MKKIFFSLALLLGTAASHAATLKVDRIDPTNWFAGMTDTELQLMVYGKDIAMSAFSVDYPGVKVDSVVRLDSPNYLLVYLNMSGAQPGQMKLQFTQGKHTATVDYMLLRREMDGSQRKGFTNADALYLLMPDRFANGDTSNDVIKGMDAVVDRSKPSLRHGGDLEGIRQHLDYFTELGVTALWFTPVLENNSPDNDGNSTYHGYATTDYYRVDPRFGTNQEYRRLTDEAHAKGLKVVMDMIFNHCGFEHPWVGDMPSKDWFNKPEWLSAATDEDKKAQYLQTSYKLTPVVDPYASKVDMSETVDGWFVPSMPDLNQRNPHVMRYLVQNSMWWIETIGIDGIRMDTYPYAHFPAMAQWMATLNKEYPNFNVVGETWVTEPAYTAAFQKDCPFAPINSNLKTVMDFSFYDKINQARTEQTDAWWKGLNRIYNSLCYDYLYADPSHVLAFIENHDTDRFLANTQKVDVLKQALGLLLTINRIPQLYYGTEILMNGTKEVTDGNVRKDFPGGFPDDEQDGFNTLKRNTQQEQMFRWTSKLLHWRKGNRLISEGKQIQFIPYEGVYVVARQLDGQTCMTILNGTDQEAPFHLERYAELLGGVTKVTDVITGERITPSTGLTSLSPRQTLIIEF